MVKLVCHHGGRVTHIKGNIDYAESKVTTIQARKDILLLELKQIVSRACKLSDNVADIDLNWKMLIQKWPECYQLVPINTQVALDAMFEIFEGDYLMIFVTTKQTPPKPAASAKHTAANIGERSQSVASFAQNHATARNVRDEVAATVNISSGPQSVVNLKVGSRFGSREVLDGEVKKWHTKNGYTYCVGYSTQSFVIYRCGKDKDGKCMWSLMGCLVSGGGGAWEIESIGRPHNCCCIKNKEKQQQQRNIDLMAETIETIGRPHSCCIQNKDKQQPNIDLMAETIDSTGRPHSCIQNKNQQQPNIDLMAETIESTVRADTGVKVSTLQEMLQAKFMQDVTLSRTWHAKQTVIEKMYGTHEGAFQQLPGLMIAIQQSNPETVFEFAWKEPTTTPTTTRAVFDMMFWAFGASIEGFKYCRPMMGIGATALCGKYAGNLLVAVGYDSNNDIYPLCYAIVNSKTSVSWVWFLERVYRHMIRDRSGICILSDFDDEIKLAVEKVLPEPLSYHRFCARQLAKTLNDKFKNEALRARWYEMAKCSFKPKFDEMFEQFKTMENGKYRQWLTTLLEKKETWALAYDKGYRYGIMATNFKEVFGDFLRGTRVLPVTALVEATFFRTNDYFNTRRAQIQQSIEKGDIWPTMVRTEIEKCMDKKCCDMEVIVFSQGREYQILMTSEAGQVRERRSCYMVNIEDRSCDCGEWTLFHRPCSHAMSAMIKANMEYKDYVDSFFGMDSYLGAYTPEFHPLRNEYFRPKWTGPVVECDPTMLRKSSCQTSSTQQVQTNPAKRMKKNH